VDHDNRIGDYTHISVGARLAGTVTVGQSVWVGIGSVVSNNLTICDGCYLGAGAVVVKDITVPGTYVGVPARKIK
jgi:UDP-3-O-[3-hydroxymyristoyl] glucosamine N-acyltransferase